ncbi:MAG: hypothetical protein AAB217_07025, partial [Chloroflexota bacterium]
RKWRSNFPPPTVEADEKNREALECGDKSFSLRTILGVISRFLISTTYGIRYGCKIISAFRS